MEISLNHTIVYAHDNVESARFYEALFGFQFVKEWGHFAVVKVNSTLTFDFVTKESFTSMHYAFKVSEQQFDEIFVRIKAASIIFGSAPNSKDDGEINKNFGGRGVYFKDPNGHVLEILTTDFIID